MMKTVLAVALLVSSASAQSLTWIRSPVNGHLYALTPGNWEFSQSETYAQSLGGHVVTIRNKAENDWLTQTFPNSSRNVMIGLRRDSRNQWYWVSGEPLNYIAFGCGRVFPSHYTASLNRFGAWCTSVGSRTFAVLELKQKASFTVSGTGCGSGSAPAIQVPAQPPSIGTTVTIKATGFPARPQFGFLVLGLSGSLWGAIPLPLDLAILGMNGCHLYASPDLTLLTTTNSSGESKSKFAVPFDVNLLGSTVFSQVAMPDAPANATGLATSNGCKIVLGT